MSLSKRSLTAGLFSAMVSSPVDAFRVSRQSRGGDCFSPYDGQILFDVEACTDTMVKQILSVDCKHLVDDLALPGADCTEWQAVCSQKVAKELTSQFPSNVVVLSSDAGEHFRKASGSANTYVSIASTSGEVDKTFYEDWRNLEDITSKVKSAVDNSDGVATLETFGTTNEGRDITAVRLTGQGYKSGAPKVFFTFTLHAREWITTMSGVFAVESMIARAKADPSWLAGMEVVLVPVANPDGFDYSIKTDRFWRKNMAPKPKGWFSCAGVDLNRQWAKDWGGRGSTSTRSCSDVYVGTAAMSEPEIMALDTLVKETPLTVHVDVHSFSELILESWSYTKAPHPRRAEFDDLGGKMTAAIKAVHGVDYPHGDNLLYEASGVFSDYTTTQGALGFTYEARPGKNAGIGGFAPPVSDILPCAEEILEGLTAAVDWAKANR